MNTQLSTIFAATNLRLTTPRRQIFEALRSSGNPLSIVQLVAACPTIDKASVYRTVALFSKLDIISTVTHGWKQSYELSAPFIPHHHHMTCDSCGISTALQSESFESLLHTLSEQHGFTPLSHHFEIRGKCHDCSKLL